MTTITTTCMYAGKVRYLLIALLQQHEHKIKRRKLGSTEDWSVTVILLSEKSTRNI